MSKCQECKCNSDISNIDMQNEFNKNLCDDCYTEYRVTLQHMFGLKDLCDVDNLLRRVIMPLNMKNY